MHFEAHVPFDFDISASGYTEDALNFRNAFWDLGREAELRSGGMGWKISMPWGPGGIYTFAGIVTFWYEDDW